MAVDLGPLGPPNLVEPETTGVSETAEIVEERAVEELLALMPAAHEACAAACKCHDVVVASQNARSSYRNQIRGSIRLPSCFTNGLHAYRNNMEEYGSRAEECYRLLPGEIESLRQSALTMKSRVAALRGCYERLYKGAPAETRGNRLKGAIRVASLLLMECDKLRDFEREAADYLSYLHSDKEGKKPSSLKAGFIETNEALKKLAEAVGRVIEVHERTAQSHILAEQSIDIVRAMEKEKFTEPRKPTVEEVSRYLGQVDTWCRKYLPAQRTTAENLLTLRKHLAALNEAIRLLSPLYRKVRYLEKCAVPYDVEALVVCARDLLDWVKRAARAWSSDVEKWMLLELDSSIAVTEIADDEPALMDELRERLKNVGIGVANKCLAHAAWKQILAEKPKRDFPNQPAFSPHRDFALLLSDTADFVKEREEIEAERELHDAKVHVAWEAYEARREAARKASGSCYQRAAQLERALGYKHPISDEMRVVVITAKKLRDIHNLFLNLSDNE